MHISTAGTYEASLTGFWEEWLRALRRAVERPAARLRLGDVYDAAERAYWAANRELEQHNARIAATEAAAALPTGGEAAAGEAAAGEAAVPSSVSGRAASSTAPLSFG